MENILNRIKSIIKYFNSLIIGEKKVFLKLNYFTKAFDTLTKSLLVAKALNLYLCLFPYHESKGSFSFLHKNVGVWRK